MDPFVALVFAVTFWRVEGSKGVELIEWCKDHEDDIPDQQDNPQLLIQFPAVHVTYHNQEDYGGKQAEGRVYQTWKYFNRYKGHLKRKSHMFDQNFTPSPFIP